MSDKDLKQAYKTVMEDHFPNNMEITFSDNQKRQTLFFEKVSWLIDGVKKGLRYGENPGQEAALYKLVNGNLVLGDTKCIQPGNYLASDVELLQSGKHPGKTNLTDADNALNILRYFQDTPCCVIVKHNNPCGVAKGSSLADAYFRANKADRLAAFGGAIALNRTIDMETAKLITENYAEVVVAPEFAPGVMEIFAQKKNLRVIQIRNIDKLQQFIGQRFVDFKSLIDGGLIVQWSYVPQTRTIESLLPAKCEYKGKEYKVMRQPSKAEYDDLLFGWLVESGITSNSVIYVKDGVTVGIGTGEQDRVGVAEIARDKAYRKLADWIAWERYNAPYNTIEDGDIRRKIDEEVADQKGGLIGSAMVSDAFFPFRDGVDVGINEKISSIIQPGGSMRDFEVIEACNEANVAMVFTGQRSFKH
ncbi:MAG: IMP cyclohydrolase [Spirochaetales bacterium]|nr:IMP cyclohydrolase [Spirochaetales bacterium]